MSDTNIVNSLNGARVVVADPSSGLIFAWFGGPSMGISGYDNFGNQVAYWTMGGCAGDNATEAEVRASIQRKIQDQDFPF